MVRLTFQDNTLSFILVKFISQKRKKLFIAYFYVFSETNWFYFHTVPDTQ